MLKGPLKMNYLNNKDGTLNLNCRGWRLIAFNSCIVIIIFCFRNKNNMLTNYFNLSYDVAKHVTIRCN